MEGYIWNFIQSQAVPQIYQQDIVARNFVDGYGKKQIYQVVFSVLITQNCALQAKGYFNTPSYIAWAFQSGSPLKQDFDRVILYLTEVISLKL